MYGYLSHVVQRIPEIRSICWCFMQVYIELVMLKSVVTSLCVLSTASMTALMCCLLTCVAYLVTFSIEMTCTDVSCCWVCVMISWLTLFLMSLSSLVVAVSVNQLRVSPKKGKTFPLVHLLKGDMSLKEGSIFNSRVTVRMSGL